MKTWRGRKIEECISTRGKVAENFSQRKTRSRIYSKSCSQPKLNRRIYHKVWLRHYATRWKSSQEESREPDPDGGSSHILVQVGRWNLCNVHLPLRLAVQGGQKSELCGILDGFPLQEQLPILHVVCHDAHKASHVLLHHILGSVAVEEERLAPNVV